MGRLAVPLEEGESSNALALTDMVLNPQPTNQASDRAADSVALGCVVLAPRYNFQTQIL